MDHSEKLELRACDESRKPSDQLTEKENSYSCSKNDKGRLEHLHRLESATKSFESEREEEEDKHNGIHHLIHAFAEVEEAKNRNREICSVILSAVLLFALGENFMFFVPLAFGSAGVILYRLTSLKVWLLLAIGMILLHAFSFLYALAMALTIGAFGAVAMFAFCDIMVLIPMADLYLLGQYKKK